eukprot:TRINITY_DN5127_c1_g1_i1.p2 TRINITY_DN5127_c1_g1~~TRINITY_DN5127_c1_g1_i1.p2  ORF type:complete len:122 (+),score=4.60 TRINITY_DN5127_c1_g1_i1:285-650(+)
MTQDILHVGIEKQNEDTVNKIGAETLEALITLKDDFIQWIDNNKNKSDKERYEMLKDQVQFLLLKVTTYINILKQIQLNTFQMKINSQNKIKAANLLTLFLQISRDFSFIISKFYVNIEFR